MPELPEVETIKNYLKRFVVGKRILNFENLNKKQIKVSENDVVGKKILDIERMGKILIIKLSGNKNLTAHLKMSGQFLYFPRNLEKGDLKYARAIFKLNKGYLVFNDVRKFGWLRVGNEEIQKLGIEPFSKKFNIKNLEEIFKQTKRPIKLVLMDQRKIAGIGNIYANEALFLAKINPQKPANKLTKSEIKRLKNSIIKILKKALKYEGTSSRFYLKPDQTKGHYQEKFLVYQKTSKDCPRCGKKIKKIILGGRSTFYCPFCQK